MTWMIPAHGYQFIGHQVRSGFLPHDMEGQTGLLQPLGDGLRLPVGQEAVQVPGDQHTHTWIKHRQKPPEIPNMGQTIHKT